MQPSNRRLVTEAALGPLTDITAFASEMEAARDDAEAARDDAEAARAYVEGIVITDLGTTDGQTKALIETPSSQTAAALSATIAALATVKPDLTSQLLWGYSAHRGGKTRFAEHSMEGYRACARAGFALEVDVHALSDGTLVPLHDNTVDRTTTGTGGVNTKTRAQWKALRLKTPVAGSPQPVPPTWDEVLAEFGGRNLIIVECKTPAALAPLIDSITSRNLHQSVIFNSFTLSDVQAAAAAGIEAAYLTNTETDFAGLLAQGIRYVTVSGGIGGWQAYVTAAAAAGMKVIVYGLITPASGAAAFTAGAHNVMDDDPWRMSGQYPKLDSDPFREQTPWPYYTVEPTTSIPADAEFRAPHEFGRVQGFSSPSGLYVGQGWAGVRSGNVKIRGSFRFLGPASAETRWAAFAFGVWPEHPGVYKDTPATAGQNAYQALIRRNGSIELFKNTAAGGTTPLGTFAGTEVAAAGQEGTVRMELNITPTGVTWTNLTTGQQVVSEDTSLRSPGRLSLSFNGADCLVSDISIVDQ